MKNKILFLITILSLFANEAFSQDKMVLRAKKDTLFIKVIEVGTEEIKYKNWPVDESMPMFSESRDRISVIVFQNGNVMKFSDNEFNNKANYADQNTMNIKLDPFSFLTNSTCFAFEKSRKPGQSYEIGLGIVGLGTNSSGDYNDAAGVFLRAGYKFINTPDYYMKGMRYTHLLKGGYIKPEIVLLAHNYTNKVYDYNYNPSTGVYTYNTYDNTYRVSGYSFMLNFGKQWVYSDIFCVDVFAGLGIGQKNVTLTNGSNSINTYTSSNPPFFGFSTYTPGEVNLTFQSGLKIGILFGKKKY
ncbi:MAG: hypothetical protein ACOVP1_01655 [Bacteroidia bacterium]